MARKQGSETVSIHAEWWDASETVEILASMTHGIKKQIEARAMSFLDTSSIDPNNPDSMKEVKIDVKAALAVSDDLELMLFIKSWTFVDAQGAALPLSQASIDGLAEEDIEFIKAEIDKRDTSKITAEQRAAFLLKQSSGTASDIPPSTLLPGG